MEAQHSALHGNVICTNCCFLHFFSPSVDDNFSSQTLSTPSTLADQADGTQAVGNIILSLLVINISISIYLYPFI